MKTRLKEIRENKGLSQGQLSKITKVSQAQICRIENETRTMTVDTAVKICKALKISSDYLLKLDDDYTKNIKKEDE